MSLLRPKKGRFLLYYSRCPNCKYINTWVSGQPDYDRCKKCRTELLDDGWKSRYESEKTKREFLEHQWDDLKKDKSPEPKKQLPAPINTEDDRAQGKFRNPYPDKDPMQLLNRTANWISSRAHLSPEDKSWLENSVFNHKQKFEVFLSVIGIQRVQRLVVLMDIANVIEGELYTPDRIADATTKELIRMMDILAGTIQNSLDLVKMLIGKDTINLQFINNQNNVNVGTNAALQTVNSRESVRQIVDTLINTTGKVVTVKDSKDDKARKARQDIRQDPRKAPRE